MRRFWLCLELSFSPGFALRVLGQADGIYADFSTSMGSFTCRLEYAIAPKAVANFIGLATGARPWLDLPSGVARTNAFYNGVTFHRVVPGFVIQAGDPQSKQNHGIFDGLGTGGPGYGFGIETPAAGLAYDKYVVAMANTGQPDSNGSQFFIDLADLPQLPLSYTIFGKVTDGTSVVDAIGQVPTNGTPDTGPQNVPLDPVVIQSISLRGSAQPSQG